MKKFIFFLFFLSIFILSNAQVFSTKQQISQTNAPEAIASADLNNDGYIDVIYSSITDHKIAISLFNPSKQNFDDEQIISANFNYAVSIFPADLDNDNLIDILAVSQQNNTVVWFKNTGNGQFSTANTIADNIQSPACVIAADIDNDGDYDVVSASKSDNKIVWFENNGAGNFINQHEIASFSGIPVTISASDIDNDNDIDIIAGYALSDKIFLFKNNADGTFDQGSEISDQVDYICSIKTADLNNDGYDDIIALSKNDNKLSWFQNDKNGNFSEQIIISDNVNYGYAIDIADFNNDNQIDIVCSAKGGNQILLFFNNNSNFTLYYTIPDETSAPQGITANDFNNDGLIDFAAALSENDPDEVVWYQNGNANFFAHIINYNHTVKTICPYDINNDGNIDIFYANETGVYFLKNLGNGNFDNEITISEISDNISCLKLADLDNDSDADIIVADAMGDHIFWQENTDGLGNFASPTTIDANSNGPIDLCLSDFDNDGDIDFVASLVNENKIAIFKNNGNASFSKTIITDTIGQARIGLSDVNNDNFQDIIISKTHYVGCILNDQNGNFNTFLIIHDNLPYDMASKIISADMNNDNYNDFVLNPDLALRWYKNNHDSSFVPFNIDIYGGIYDLTVADFNNDNDIDIVTSSRILDYVYLCQNQNYADTFIIQYPIVVKDANELAYADLNNDGYNDIIVGSWPSEQIAWLENYYLHILQNPENQYVCENDKSFFAIIAAKANTFQWQVNSGSGFDDITDTNIYSGINKAKLIINSVTSDMFGNQYRCIIKDTENNQVISDAATLSEFQPSMQCIENQTRTANTNNVYIIQQNEFDIDTIFNKCNAELHLTNNINDTETLENEELTIGTHQIIWYLKNNNNQIIDSCSFDVEIVSNTSLNNTLNKNLTIFPNPTSGIINISKNNNKLENCTIQISDIYGKIIFQSNKIVRQIDISNQPQGIYFIKISGKNLNFTQKIIKIKN